MSERLSYHYYGNKKNYLFAHNQQMTQSSVCFSLIRHLTILQPTRVQECDQFRYFVFSVQAVSPRSAKLLNNLGIPSLIHNLIIKKTKTTFIRLKILPLSIQVHLIYFSISQSKSCLFYQPDFLEFFSFYSLLLFQQFIIGTCLSFCTFFLVRQSFCLQLSLLEVCIVHFVVYSFKGR